MDTDTRTHGHKHGKGIQPGYNVTMLTTSRGNGDCSHGHTLIKSSLERRKSAAASCMERCTSHSGAKRDVRITAPKPGRTSIRTRAIRSLTLRSFPIRPVVQEGTLPLPAPSIPTVPHDVPQSTSIGVPKPETPALGRLLSTIYSCVGGEAWRSRSARFGSPS